jgi:hypothetical protein
MSLMHGSVNEMWAAIVGGMVLAGMKCAAMDFSELRGMVNDAILDCLERGRIPIKEAADCAGMTETHFRKALSGEGNRQISIVHLMGLPFDRFWLHFGPTLLWLAAKKHAKEIAENFTLRRA